jgi:hypothetical protein
MMGLVKGGLAHAARLGLRAQVLFWTFGIGMLAGEALLFAALSSGRFLLALTRVMP